MTQSVSVSQFAPKSRAERVWLAFDFSALAESLLSPVVSIARYAGAVDEAANDVLSGAAVVDGAKVLQFVVDGIEGADYLLTCQVDSADGSRFVLPAVLPVRAKA